MIPKTAAIIAPTIMPYWLAVRPAPEAAHACPQRGNHIRAQGLPQILTAGSDGDRHTRRSSVHRIASTSDNAGHTDRECDTADKRADQRHCQTAGKGHDQIRDGQNKATDSQCKPLKCLCQTPKMKPATTPPAANSAKE